MKIVSSALRMEAASAHRDVVGTGVKAAHSASFADGERFKLDIPQLEAGMSRVGINMERQTIASQVKVEAEGGNSHHVMAVEKVVSHGVTQAVGQQTQIQKIRQTGKAIPIIDTKNEIGIRTGREQSGDLLSLELERLEYRQEQVRMETAGEIETDDGRSISLQMKVTMERDEASLERVAARTISSRFVDPLVLSFSDGLSVLSDNEFNFDLDSDGELDRVSGLANGSGYLVFDHNEDGLVNDGGELFGPQTGSGYDELRIYDEDNNNWIDENDPAFKQFKIWMGAGGEEAKMVSLAEAGVGALSLANSSSHFNLKDGAGRVLGQVSNSGLFLTEDGDVRPLVEIDLNMLDERGTEPESNASAVQTALLGLRDVIVARRQRLERLAALKVAGISQKETADHEEWLLNRIAEMREQQLRQK